MDLQGVKLWWLRRTQEPLVDEGFNMQNTLLCKEMHCVSSPWSLREYSDELRRE